MNIVIIQTVKTPGKYTEMIKKHMDVVILIFILWNRKELLYLQK